MPKRILKDLDNRSEEAESMGGNGNDMDVSSSHKRSTSPGKRSSPYRRYEGEDEDMGKEETRNEGDQRNGPKWSGGGGAKSEDNIFFGTTGQGGGRRKGEGKGKGGNQGRGEYTPMEVDNSTSGILKTHSRILARLAQDKREEARRVQWVFEMAPGSILVQKLDEAGVQWASERKGLGKGQRMEWEKHEHQWSLFIQYTYEAIKQFQQKNDTKEDKKAAKHVQNWAELAWAEEEIGEKKGAVQQFRMVGRLEEEGQKEHRSCGLSNTEMTHKGQEKHMRKPSGAEQNWRKYYKSKLGGITDPKIRQKGRWTHTCNTNLRHKEQKTMANK